MNILKERKNLWRLNCNALQGRDVIQEEEFLDQGALPIVLMDARKRHATPTPEFGVPEKFREQFKV